MLPIPIQEIIMLIVMIRKNSADSDGTNRDNEQENDDEDSENNEESSSGNDGRTLLPFP
jgi:hypothetical protein